MGVRAGDADALAQALPTPAVAEWVPLAEGVLHSERGGVEVGEREPGEADGEAAEEGERGGVRVGAPLALAEGDAVELLCTLKEAAAERERAPDEV